MQTHKLCMDGLTLLKFKTNVIFSLQYFSLGTGKYGTSKAVCCEVKGVGKTNKKPN